ncbi:hypothetical protein SAMN05192549_105223 [Duganella sacchari]|uniref:Phasin family protein n=1 Tax=Duganella sacchari TaxID=551987 RepID=A0A1M7PMP1_9BURK|nr:MULTISPECIES: hypothetical protein [Duganella]MYM30702.1 hypothetical protein [Duganella sp. CY15W]SHN18459.1 hypothetical protein SAMN05192549_105223 [Duganella sacchari]
MTTTALSSFDFGKTAVTTAQSQFAQIVKSTLAVFNQWRDWQAEAGTKLLHTQLDLLQPPGAAISAQNLLALPFGLSTDLVAQQKEVLQSLLTRNNALVEDLRKSQNKEDISLVMAGYLSDVDGLVRDNAGKVMTLLNSVSSATTVLTERTLDDLIAADPQKKLPSPA